MKTKFVFLLLPQIHILDLAGPDQALHEAIEYGADFEIEYCCDDKAITTSAGLPLGNVKHYSKVTLAANDFLIIPGSNAAYLLSDEFIANKSLHTWIIRNYQKGVQICSICAGAFALGIAGLLDNIPCTTHFKRTKQLQKLFPKTTVIENILYTDHEGIYTSAGIVSGIDMTLYIIEKLKGSYFTHLVARELVVYNRRNGNMAQESELMKYRNHIHAGIHTVQDWIYTNIHIKSTIPFLAEKALMSERNFTRVFRKETNVSVNQYINHIRKEKIIALLKQPDLSKDEIAGKVGLQSQRQLNRIIKE